MMAEREDAALDVNWMVVGSEPWEVEMTKVCGLRHARRVGHPGPSLPQRSHHWCSLD